MLNTLKSSSEVQKVYMLLPQKASLRAMHYETIANSTAAANQTSPMNMLSNGQMAIILQARPTTMVTTNVLTVTLISFMTHHAVKCLIPTFRGHMTT